MIILYVIRIICLKQLTITNARVEGARANEGEPRIVSCAPHPHEVNTTLDTPTRKKDPFDT